MWLRSVRDLLETPLWLAHQQVWSVREEMFLEWAAPARFEAVQRGAVPPGAALTRRERQARAALNAECGFVGRVVGGHIASFLHDRG